MGIKHKYRALWSNRALRKLNKIDLTSDKALSFVCDCVILLPVRKSEYGLFKYIDAIVCEGGYPLFRLHNAGSLVCLDQAESQFRLDIMGKSNLPCVYPIEGRLRVDWTGEELRVTGLL